MSAFDCHLLIDLIVGMAENNDVNRSQAESLPMSLAKCKDSVKKPGRTLSAQFFDQLDMSLSAMGPWQSCGGGEIFDDFGTQTVWNLSFAWRSPALTSPQIWSIKVLPWSFWTFGCGYAKMLGCWKGLTLSHPMEEYGGMEGSAQDQLVWGVAELSHAWISSLGSKNQKALSPVKNAPSMRIPWFLSKSGCV